jgi:flagellar basal-body rod protein FlgB
MPTIDTGLDFYRRVLDLRAYRQQILTADIANASTPHFKAIDLDFKEALAATSPEPGAEPTAEPAARFMLVDDPRQIEGAAADAVGASVAGSIKYQSGMPVTIDGNSVDLNQEKAAAGENAVQYEAAASFASQIIKLLSVAINGASGASANGGS